MLSHPLEELHFNWPFLQRIKSDSVNVYENEEQWFIFTLVLWSTWRALLWRYGWPRGTKDKEPKACEVQKKVPSRTPTTLSPSLPSCVHFVLSRKAKESQLPSLHCGWPRRRLTCYMCHMRPLSYHLLCTTSSRLFDHLFMCQKVNLQEKSNQDNFGVTQKLSVQKLPD